MSYLQYKLFNKLDISKKDFPTTQGFQLSSHNELQQNKPGLKLLVEHSQIVNVLKPLQGKRFILGDVY